MKELSIEQKAKAYDEVRKKIAIRFGSNVADEIFSQFEISDDEKIRKAIINEISLLEKESVIEQEKNVYQSWIAWLEKKGEQKPVIEMKTPEESLGISSEEYNKIVDECIYGDDKSAWSEKDEENLNWFEKFFRAESVIAEGKDIPQDRYLWFKNLKNRRQLQPKQEWSEKDEKMLQSCINIFQSMGLMKAYIKWLKSLKERVQPQNRWKPSEEQMDILDMVLTNESMDDNIARILRELREQLKKL